MKKSKSQFLILSFGLFVLLSSACSKGSLDIQYGNADSALAPPDENRCIVLNPTPKATAFSGPNNQIAEGSLPRPIKLEIQTTLTAEPQPFTLAETDFDNSQIEIIQSAATDLTRHTLFVRPLKFGQHQLSFKIELENGDLLSCGTEIELEHAQTPAVPLVTVTINGSLEDVRLPNNSVALIHYSSSPGMQTCSTTLSENINGTLTHTQLPLTTPNAQYFTDILRTEGIETRVLQVETNCSHLDGRNYSDGILITINPSPFVLLQAFLPYDPNPYSRVSIAPGGSVLLRWTSVTPLNCQLVIPGAPPLTVGSSGEQPMENIVAPLSVAVICLGPNQTNISSTIAVSILNPVATLTANGVSGTLVKPLEGNITLAWDSMNALSCAVTGGGLNLSGIRGTYNIPTERITVNTTYRVTCSNTSGSATDSVSISTDISQLYFGYTAAGSFDIDINEVLNEDHDFETTDFRTIPFKMSVETRLLSALTATGVSYRDIDVNLTQVAESYAEITSITRNSADRTPSENAADSYCYPVPAEVFATSRMDAARVSQGGLISPPSSTTYLYKNEARDRYAAGRTGVKCFPTIHSSLHSQAGGIIPAPTLTGSGFPWADPGVQYYNTYGNGAYVYVDGNTGRLRLKYQTQHRQSRVVFLVGIQAAQ